MIHEVGLTMGVCLASQSGEAEEYYIIVVTATTGTSWTEDLVFCTDNEESVDDFDASVTVELLVK